MKNCHRMHTRHKHTTSAWRNTHTFHTQAATAPCVTIQTENSLHKHTTYSTLQCFKNTIFNNSRYTTNMCHLHTSIVSRHLATRDNNKILRIPSPHISASLVAPLPDSEQINHSSSSHTYTSQCQNTSITTMPPLYHSHTQHTSSLQLHPHTHHIVTHWTCGDKNNGVTTLLAKWTENLACGTQAERLDSTH